MQKLLLGKNSKAHVKSIFVLHTPACIALGYLGASTHQLMCEGKGKDGGELEERDRAIRKQGSERDVGGIGEERGRSKHINLCRRSMIMSPLALPQWTFGMCRY